MYSYDSRIGAGFVSHTYTSKAYGVAWLGWWHKIVEICKQDVNNVEKDSRVRKCNK